MKRIVCFLLVGLWLLQITWGCQLQDPVRQEPDKAETEATMATADADFVNCENPLQLHFDDGDLSVLGYRRDRQDLSAAFKVNVTWQKGEAEQLLFKMKFSDTALSSLQTMKTELRGDDGRLRWAYEFSYNPLVPNEGMIVEKSVDDELRIIMAPTSDSEMVEKHIWLDGNVYEFRYDPQLLHKFQSGERLTRTEANMIEALRESFDGSYEYVSSLNQNRYGTLTNFLLGDGIPAQVIPNTPAPEEDMNTLDAFCAFLSSAAAVKCTLGGGPLNPFCHAFLISALVCWGFAFIIHWVIGNSDD